jgi:hypothetical protein
MGMVIVSLLSLQTEYASYCYLIFGYRIFMGIGY